MGITYRPASAEDYEQVRSLLSDEGWGDRVLDPDSFRRMMEGAARTVVAFDGARVVGFARALCDEASNGYISTVAVASDMRRRGIGRELVRRLIEQESPGSITWVLRAGRGSEEFWKKMGFQKSHVAMEKLRER
jgi:N-acetylglutamate synthase-like GNAT family acetyltransferase